MSRLIYGARLSLLIGLSVVTLSLAVGIVLGLTAAFVGGTVDVVIMRLMDIVLVFPSLLLAIVIVAILGPSLFNAMLAVSVVTLPSYTRLVRAAALSELARDYVTADALRRGGPAAADVQHGAAELHRAADRAGDARVLVRHPRRGGARLPRPRRAAADAGMGHDAVRRAAILPERLVGAGLSGLRHSDHGAGVQPVRRRAQGYAGSEIEALRFASVGTYLAAAACGYFAATAVSPPANDQVELGKVGGDLRYWRAKEALRHAELRLGVQAKAGQALEQRATAIIGWTVLAGLALGAAVVNGVHFVAAALTASCLLLAALLCIIGLTTREWIGPGYRPEALMEDRHGYWK